jgi:tetratricopeptide (TPR) repeat protein
VYDKAVNDCKTAIRIDPQNAEAYHILGDISWGFALYEEALKNYQQALNLSSKPEEKIAIENRIHEIKQKLAR